MTHCNLTLSPGCFLTAEHTHEMAVKAPSQSVLIDYTHAIRFKYFKGSLTVVLSIQILQRKSVRIVTQGKFHFSGIKKSVHVKFLKYMHLYYF